MNTVAFLASVFSDFENLNCNRACRQIIESFFEKF